MNSRMITALELDGAILLAGYCFGGELGLGIGAVIVGALNIITLAP